MTGPGVAGGAPAKDGSGWTNLGLYLADAARHPG